MKRFVTKYGTRALVAVLALMLAGPIGYAGAAWAVARAAVHRIRGYTPEERFRSGPADFGAHYPSSLRR